MEQDFKRTKPLTFKQLPNWTVIKNVLKHLNLNNSFPQPSLS